MLEYDIINKKQIVKKILEFNFDTSNSKAFKVEAFRNSIVYINKAKSYLSGLYYLIV